MIEKVRIRNFQSWEDQVLELEPFTVIVGDSDVGKSAFIRALSAFQGPLVGKDFVKHGAKKASVEIWFGGHTLMFEKGEGVNRYVLDGVSFEKVGRQVPEEVCEVFDITPERFKQEVVSLNVDGQFDSPFLLFLPGTTVAQVIGAVLNLNLIFLALHKSTQDTHKEKLRLSSETYQVESLQNNLLNCADPASISFVKTKLTSLRTWEGSYFSLKEIVSKLGEEVQKAHSLKEEYQKMNVDVAVPGPEPLVSMTEQTGMVELATSFLLQEGSQKEELEATEWVDGFDFVGQEVPDFSVAISSVQSATTLVRDAREMKGEYTAYTEEESRLTDEQFEVERALDELIGELKVCPLSGVVLSDECKAGIHG